MGWLEALVLGIVQGLTEFLPISSSAHQSIIGQAFGGSDPGSAFTAITQLGTESAVIIFFRKDIWLIIKSWTLALIGKLPRNDPEARLGWGWYSRTQLIMGCGTFGRLLRCSPASASSSG
jgi:undecaprenyl-diphosphatase